MLGTRATQKGAVQRPDFGLVVKMTLHVSDPAHLIANIPADKRMKYKLPVLLSIRVAFPHR